MTRRRRTSTPGGPPLENARAQLRAVLREYRRLLDDPSFDEAKKEEDDIRESEEKLDAAEAKLKAAPPDKDKADEFQDEIIGLQSALAAFEAKLHRILRREWPNQPNWPKELYRLVASFEDLLHRAEKLLLSLEDLLRRLPELPPELLQCFEERVERHLLLIDSFAKLVLPLPPDRARVASFLELLGGSEKLCKSFEDLVKRETPTDYDRVKSFDGLLGILTFLLVEFLGELDRLLPAAPPLKPNDRPLLVGAEDRLRDLETLLGSFEDLVKEHAAQHPEIVGQFENRLKECERLLSTFEGLVKRVAPKDRPLRLSFEKLLHALVDLLVSFDAALGINVPPPWALVKSFEDLLHQFEKLLDSFEDLVRNAPDEELVKSFEDLLHGLRDLIERFNGRRREFPDDDGLAGSYKTLQDGLQDLIASLLKLKESLPKISEDLQESDRRIQDLTLGLIGAWLGSLGEVSPARAEEAVTAVVTAAKGLVDLGRLLARQRRLAADMPEGFRRLVAQQARLNAEAQRIVARARGASPYLTDAIEDLAWLQQRLEELAAGLGRPRRR